MKFTLDTKLSLEQNAALYFDRAKKAKRKLEGAKQALERTHEQMSTRTEQRVREEAPVRKPAWYEKFRWSYTSDGFLIVGGRDANSNESLVKKHADAKDIVFHTDMAGSPFFILKTEGKEVPERSLEEAAKMTASYSRAWREGLGVLEVFHVTPDQLSKSPQPGEFIGKGSFIVRGELSYLKPQLGIAIGKEESGRIMAGAPGAVKSRCAVGFEILQGNEKTSDVSKRLAKLLETSPDVINPLLPAGGVRMGRRL